MYYGLAFRTYLLLTLADRGGGARGATYPPSKSRPNSFKCRQNAPSSVLDFKMFSLVPNRFNCRQNAPFSVPVFNIFSAVPNRFKYRQKSLSLS